ncbi:MAG TPA: SMC-Scp complex subunit ScpB [Micromonosporaceae bacterium]|nr:SMC-Scp complex subunit ScpB [Micromonosporaceae bacterium]
MTGDERRQSLADEAAAWVPPWQRGDVPAQPEATTSGRPAEPEPAASSPAPVPDPQDQINFREIGPTEPMDNPNFREIELINVVEAGISTDAERPEPEGQDETVTTSPGDPPTEPSAEPLVESRGELLGEPPGKSSGEPLGEPPGERSAGPLDEAPGGPDPAAMDPVELRGALEAILLVVDEPVSEAMLAQVLQQPAELLARTLPELAAEYTAARRGFELRRAAGGWRLYTRGEYASYVERFVLDGQQVRLTQAALETLAVVAYKQPVTRSRISAIRGVNCDAVVRTLVSRGLIEECGTEPDSGAYLYRTTTLFLEKLALDSVADLPPLAPFLPDDVDELTDAPPR